jgi:hypothetical protein
MMFREEQQRGASAREAGDARAHGCGVGCSEATLVLVASISSSARTEKKDSTAPASTRKQLKREEQKWCSQRSNISAVEEVVAHPKKGAADDRGSALMLLPGSAWRRQSRQRAEGLQQARGHSSRGNAMRPPRST